MKKNYILTIIFIFCVQFINSQTIVSTSAENRNAVVEELTGIHCWACPDGHRILNDAKAIYPNRIFVIKSHSGGFAWDCTTTGGYNFNTQWNNGEYESLMQNGGAYPAASVNRQTFSGFPHYVSGGTALSRGAWAAAIEDVLSQSGYVNVAVSAQIIDSNMEILVEAYYTGDSPSSSNYLHVAILQDESHGPQFSASLNPDYVVSYDLNTTYAHATQSEELEYRHMDRLVDLINGFDGEEITSTSSGSFISRSYTYALPEMFNDVPVDINQMKVVAFIAESDQNIINGSGTKATTEASDILVSSIILDNPVVIGVSDLSVNLTNNGNNDATNFNVSYQIDGGELITEVYEENILSGQGASYTFSSQPDFSSLSGDFDITISVEMDGDSNVENDTLTQSFSIYSYCEPSMNCSFGDGFQLVQIGDINNVSECEGYGNFMNLSTDLELGSTNDLNITTGYGDQVLRVWIDYNDDSYFSTDEIVIDNLVIAQGSAEGTYNVTIPLFIDENAQTGQHIMRLKTNWQSAVSDDPCESSTYGETEDYMVNIVESLNISELDHSLINLYPNPSKGLFNAKIFGEALSFEISNILGQKVMSGVFEVGNNEINITNQENGIYIMKLRAPNGQTRNYKLIKK